MSQWFLTIIQNCDEEMRRIAQISIKSKISILSLIVLTFAATAIPVNAQKMEKVTNYPFQKVDEFKFLKSGNPISDWNPVREWTSADGRKLKAKIIAVKDEVGEFQTAKNKTTKIPFARLSKEDQQFLGEWAGVSEFFNTSFKPPRRQEQIVKADMFDGAFAKEGKIHETRNFRFECDVSLSAKITKDFSRLFEVTHTAVSKLPLGLSPYHPEEKKILVRLFSNTRDYVSEGGTPDAAGVYILKERVVLVPLASLGIAPDGNGKFRKKEFDPATLIHETAHAVMHHWLEPMPLWVSEGLADYIAAIPYQDGVLDYTKHRAGLLSLAAKKFGGNAKQFPLFEPRSFVHMGPGSFMGDTSMEEPSIRLPVVRPHQIELAKPKVTERRGSGIVLPQGWKPSFPIKPITLKPTRSNPGPDVVRRYVSSMLLIDHLLKTDPTTMQKYLFSLLHGEWSRHHYLKLWNEAHKKHTDAVNAQITAFKTTISNFNREVDTFNTAVRKHNSGLDVEVPKRPVSPTIPEALPVPAILARPKSAAELSRRSYQKSAIEKHLKLPKQLSLPESN